MKKITKESFKFNINILGENPNRLTMYKFKWNLFVDYLFEKKSQKQNIYINFKSNEELINNFHQEFLSTFPKLTKQQQEEVLNKISKAWNSGKKEDEILISLDSKTNKDYIFSDENVFSDKSKDPIQQKKHFDNIKKEIEAGVRENEYFTKGLHLINKGPELEPGTTWENKTDRNKVALVKHFSNGEVLFCIIKWLENEFVEDSKLTEDEFRSQYYKHYPLTYIKKKKIFANQGIKTLLEKTGE